MTITNATFGEVWAVDFEFTAHGGERPEPICMIARELRSGHTLKVWQDELRQLDTAPFETGSEALFVAYYARAPYGEGNEPLFRGMGEPGGTRHAHESGRTARSRATTQH